MQSSLPRDSSRSTRFRPQLTELESRITPVVAYALSDNRLIAFDTSNPAAASAPLAITGVNSSETLVGIDVRPQNGMLYGLGYNPNIGTVQLYLINNLNGVATPVGATGQFQSAGGTPMRVGVNANSRIDLDFNPAADRLRVVVSNGGATGGGQNFRINPNNGQFIDGDFGGPGTVAGLNMDGEIKGATFTVQGTAYTNNFPNTGAVTTQYTLDDVSAQISIQNPPNSGTQTGARPVLLPAGFSLDTFAGFDIDSNVVAPATNAAVTSGIAYAFANVFDSTFQRTTIFLQIDLTTGVATNLGQIPGVPRVQSLALLPLQPSAAPFGTPVVGLTRNGTTTQLVRFNSASPGTVVRVDVSGVVAGETLVGIDFRPATGQLMGVGINPTTDTGSLYLIDPQTGVASLVVGGTGSAITFRDAANAIVDLPDPLTTGYGFDFNPSVDRIRITTSNGLNFRVNPVNGQPVDGNLGGTAVVPNINTDGNINGGATGVSGTGYTNSFAPAAGQAVTTQYTIDATTNTLFIQSPPNSGTQVNPIPITLNGAPLDFTDVNGFNIPSSVQVTTSNAPVTSGSAFAALTVGGVTSLYSIDLVTGAATRLGPIDSGAAPLIGLATAQVAAGTISFSPLAYTGNEGSSVTVTLVRSGGNLPATTVTITPTPGTAGVGDFDPTPITVNFAQGQTTATATINLTSDSISEGNETFSLVLTPGAGSDVAGASATVTIIDGPGGGNPGGGFGAALVVSSGTGSGTVQVYNSDGSVRFVLAPYGNFTGGVSIAQGDVNGDGVADIVTGAGAGGGPHVKVFDGTTGLEIRSFFAYAGTFSGGVNVATADVNNDGFADIVTGAGAGGGPHVKVFDALTLAELASFFSYVSNYSSGVTVAGGDINGDGIDDVITGTMGNAAHVRGFSGLTFAEILSFFAFDPSLASGVNVAVSSGRIIAGPGAGGGDTVRVYDSTGTTFNRLTPYPGFNGGIRVAVNSAGNIVTGAGPGGAPHVKVFNPGNFVELASFFAFDVSFAGGVFVG